MHLSSTFYNPDGSTTGPTDNSELGSFINFTSKKLSPTLTPTSTQPMTFSMPSSIGRMKLHHHKAGVLNLNDCRPLSADRDSVCTGKWFLLWLISTAISPNVIWDAFMGILYWAGVTPDRCGMVGRGAAGLRGWPGGGVLGEGASGTACGELNRRHISVNDAFNHS